MLLLDSDLAELYGYELKNLNRQVKRNGRRFPEDFMFRLTQDELEQLRCQNVTTNPMSRSLPYVFTEQGIYMLATVLKGELAETNQKIFFDGQIYDAFSLLTELIQKAEQEIILIDGYVDVSTLNVLAKN